MLVVVIASGPNIVDPRPPWILGAVLDDDKVKPGNLVSGQRNPIRSSVLS